MLAHWLRPNPNLVDNIQVT